MSLCILLDENVPLTLLARLEKITPFIQVFAVGEGDGPPKGTQDTDILNWIEAHNCLLVTNNRSTMPVHLVDHLAQGRHIPGIIQLPRRLNMVAVVDELAAMAVASLAGEYQDQIVYLPLR